jgi:hypothetical protein
MKGVEREEERGKKNEGSRKGRGKGEKFKEGSRKGGGEGGKSRKEVEREEGRGKNQG